MKKYKKGFTLIELLAVVILLGLIAVISVPVVKNITKDSKQKGLEKQIDVILDSAKSWAIKNTNLLPENSSSILVKIDTLKKEGLLENKKIINPVNNKEMTGCAEISYNEDYNQYEYNYNEKCITNSGESQLLKIAVISEELGVTSVNSCATSGTCAAGTAFAIKVNNTDTYKFRVLNDENNVVTLIMSSNLYEEGNDEPDIEWLTIEHYEEETKIKLNGATNTYAPITALKALKERTTTWTNLEEYNYTLKDQYGTYADYSGEYAQNVRARLPRVSDITTDAIGCIEWETTCPDWIYEGLYGAGDDNTYGYWLSDASDIDPGSALGVDSNGTFIYAHVLDYRGVRPVIELSKTISNTIY